MRILKCDICKKTIVGAPVRIEISLRVYVEFCNECASPVLELLRKHKFLKEEKDKMYA